MYNVIGKRAANATELPLSYLILTRLNSKLSKQLLCHQKGVRLQAIQRSRKVGFYLQYYI
jgi:hypothetical protein